MSKQEEVKKLREELVDVLTRLDKIAPVRFFDSDCDNCLYNFSDVSYDKEEDTVYVELTMWSDSLPAHKDKPLQLRGKDIPYRPMSE